MADQNTIEYRIEVDAQGAVVGFKRAADGADDYAKAAARTEKAQDTLSRSASGLGQSMQQTGQRLQQSGDRVARAAQPFAAIGTAAIAGAAAVARSAANYDREFSKIEGLVGVAASEVDRMKASTLELAGETARAPQELASAMFTIQSAGLRGAAGAEALEEAAKLAAGGMGETRDIAQAMTSILDQYARHNVDAAEAADFLASTARAGNFESSQLAGSLGKVLPVASQLNIGLSDVGGAVALLTRGNGNASESITQVAAAMRVLLAPSVEATRILGEAGLTMQNVKDTAAGPGGLIAALEQMYDATGRNDEQFARMLGSSEAVNAAFQILNASGEAIEGTFGAVADSAGVAAEVFSAAADTDSFKFEQALTELKVAAIDLGQNAAPLMAGAMSTVSDVVSGTVSAFSGLPQPIQDTVTQLGGIIAVAGPAAYGLGRVASAAGSGLDSLGSMVGTLGRMNPLLVAAGGALAIGGAAFFAFQNEARRAEERADTYRQRLQEASGEADAFAQMLDILNNGLAENAEALEGAGTALADASPHAQAFYQSMEDLGQGGLVDSITSLGVSLEDLAALSLGTNTAEQAERFATALNAVRESGAEFDDFEFVKALEQTSQAAADSIEQTEAMAKAARDVAFETGWWSGEQWRAALATARATETLTPYHDAVQALSAEMVESRQAATDHFMAVNDAAGAYQNAAPAADMAADSIDASADAAENAVPFYEDLADTLKIQVDGWGAAVSAANEYQSMLDGLNSSQRNLDDATFATYDAFEALEEAATEFAAELAKVDDADLPGFLSESNPLYREFVTLAESAGLSVQDLVFAMVAAESGSVAAFQAQNKWTDSLRDTLREAGLAEDVIDDLVAAYADVPPEFVTNAVLQVEKAKENVEYLLGLFEDYGDADPEALATVDAEQARRVMAEAILTAAEFDRTEVEALLEADPADLIAAVDEAWALMDEVDRAEIWADIAARFDTISGEDVSSAMDALAADRTVYFEADLDSTQFEADVARLQALADIAVSGGSSGGGSGSGSSSSEEESTFGDPSAIAAAKASGNQNADVLYRHMGGPIGDTGAKFDFSRPLRSDERLIVGQTGERMLSREQNRWFEDMFSASPSGRVYAGSGSSGGGGGASVTVAPGAVALTVNGSNLTAGQVEKIAERATERMARQLTTAIGRTR